ncbi:hypothetical protein NUU61_009403 [Penicillium alfredii]|uniref:NAD-dependent epimerase/dehydratase domain-containing protein n=1 Tax=Penicillium alfredii TaxID=1506179 RepID=A0A9W9JWV5_9EURO|nr:uncharacterized protein NUU61_009403 [Penicillium alfredii]KAJ5084824.1 hypothetical protein NUU61_009403 [Penicillium alfredii]
MHVFVTGATGFIGQAVVQELLGAGHTVTGLARSDASATALEAKGAKVVRGSIEDIETLKRAAADSDGVIHLAFNHDFTKFAENCQVDRTAIEALGASLAGSNRPLVITSGTLTLPKGQQGTENDTSDLGAPMNMRGETEQLILEFAAKGVRASVVRLPPSVHGDGDHGFVNVMTQTARAMGESFYIGDGLNRWPAVNRFDAALLYRLALEKGAAGKRFHAVGEEGIPLKEISEAIAQSLGVSAVSKSFEEVQRALGILAFPLSGDNPTSSRQTQEQLGWTYSGQGLLADIKAGVYLKE